MKWMAFARDVDAIFKRSLDKTQVLSYKLGGFGTQQA